MRGNSPPAGEFGGTSPSGAHGPLRPTPRTEPAPPAGGFGAPREGQPTEVVHQAETPRRPSYGLHVVAIALACFVAVMIASAFMFARGRERAGRAAEARVTITEIAKALQAAQAERHELCPSARAVPADFEQVRGKRYASRPEDWAMDPGWSCAGFEMVAPQRYQYRVETTAEFVTISAAGDLDGDDVRSQYTLRGHVDPVKKQLVFEGAIHDSNDGE